MIDSTSLGRKAEAPRGKSGWMQRGILAAVCALVVVGYACAAHPGIPLSGKMSAADNYYNILVQSFRAGQLNLKKESPPRFASLPDPYDPSAHASYDQDVGDMSYYKGKLYLYFGVTPAVMLFWPYVALTGRYLLQKDATVIFCVVGFLASVGLLCAIWRRHFAEVGVAVVVAGALALGLAAGMPVMLARSDVYEVPISCGYALTMLALTGIWKALYEAEPRRRRGWLAAAGLTYGLAVGARPSLLFGAVVLLVPVVQSRRARRAVLAPLLAAVVPVALIGLGLLIYNFLRFDSPFEFGWRYQLAGMRQDTGSPFHARYLWFNFRLYFLEPARWGRRFPFVHDIIVPAEPAGHMGGLERTFGVLSNVPLVWLALAVPLGWWGRSAQARFVLCRFLGAVAVLFAVESVTISLLAFAEGRYEMEFLPTLVLLAVTGILSLEHTLAATSGRLTGRGLWRKIARCSWSLLLAFSVAFNLLASVGRCAEWHCNLGALLFRHGQIQEAVRHWEQALHLNPGYAEAYNNLGAALTKQGKVPEAIGHYEQALRLSPDYAEAHYNLGAALAGQGRLAEAIRYYEQALRLAPDSAVVHFNLGAALTKQGRLPEAIGHYEQALRLKPDYAEAHDGLGIALTGRGKVQDAIGHYEQALRLNPDDAQAYYNLGAALAGQGKLPEAIGHYEQALHIRPDYTEAHYNLGVALVQQGRLPEAISHWEQALRTKPDLAEAHINLGEALCQLGRPQEAIGHYEQSLRIRPDYAEAHYNLGIALAQQGRLPEAIGHWEQALRTKPDFAEAHFNLGLALEKLGRTQEAAQQYEHALRIKPDFIQAQNALARARAAR
jgi:tetratricopeptide (TPR) repeat protein